MIDGGDTRFATVISGDQWMRLEIATLRVIVGSHPLSLRSF
jgi:hypothetical protein